MSEPGRGGPGSGLPENEQRVWDAIVADLTGQLDAGPAVPPAEAETPAVVASAEPAPVALPPPAPPADEPEEDLGYVPPEPPPLPRPSDAIGRASWLAALGGPVVIFATTVLGWETWLRGIAVVATVAGFASLIARMKDRDDDDGNGAVI